jgi:hypothetical protein
MLRDDECARIASLGPSPSGRDEQHPYIRQILEGASQERGVRRDMLSCLNLNVPWRYCTAPHPAYLALPKTVVTSQ